MSASSPACGSRASISAWYSRGLPGSAEFRATVNRLTDAGAVEALIDRFFDPLIAAGAGRADMEPEALAA